MRRRIAVVGDELSSGGQILDYQQKHGFTFHGHKTALIGNEAFCVLCKSTGRIAKADGPYRISYDGNREAALDGDIVLCKCTAAPRIVALLAMESWVEDRARASLFATQPQSANVGYADGAQTPIYDEQFTLLGGDQRVLSNIYYSLRLPSGALVHGVTDQMGRTERYATEGAQNLRIYLGHKET